MDLLKQKELKSPYDLREMLWYIVPGATLLLLIFLFEFWLGKEIRNTEFITNNNSQAVEVFSNGKQDITNDSIKIHTPLLTALSLTFSEKLIFGDNWVFAVIYVLLLLTICYILGHITYIIGTLIYERGLLSKGFSYPYIKLLDLKQHDYKTNFEVEASKAFYKGVYTWVAVIFITTYLLQYSNSFDTLKIFLILALILFFLIPIRCKFIVNEIIDWNEENRLILKIALENNIDKNKVELKKRPRLSGYLYWPLYVGLLVSFMDLINVEITNLPAFMQDLFLNELFYYQLWVFLIITFGVLELLSRHLIFRKFNLFVMCAAKKNPVEFKNFSESDLSEFNREKLSYEFLFIYVYNFIGNEIDKFSKNYFHIQTAFDKPFITRYGNSFRKVFGEDYTTLNNHNYWLSKFYLMENSDFLSRQMVFWENTARFTKNLTTCFLLAYIYCGMSFILQKQEIKYFNKDHSALILFFIPIFYYIIAEIAVKYYIYVYDNRFNRMILRGFVTLICSRELNKNNR